eukprot:GGOE01000746.1.p1 GENE.GGOE01000746.1~~GGOE01000746.1.p1  ORF type:complete len:882 (-),score=313.77 GGOE01000746.1:304-2592(-)
MAGFYRSQYTRANGAKSIMAVTQFEAIDARRCFPCWDEPARKAVFTITLTVPKDLTALSNMPEASVEFVGDKKRVSFLPSPKMSTYLLAFVIGEFEAVQQVTTGGTLVRALCVPGRVAQLQYALSCGVRSLEFYNKFFGIPFPLPKIDMIAIPDFASGAMENWGLVTYREVDLLCDLSTVSMSQKQRITVCVSHELAHQWFGNLVTMRWWDDLWLNEGFANWMESYCVDNLLPEWKMWEVFVSRDLQRALQLDGLRTSHPIQVPIAHASEVEEVFDSISYSKGGSLVRMLFAVLGQDHFQKGLQLYFKRHAYGNTETMDLAKAWEDVSGMPIKELVGSWTEKMGFPVLKVVKDPFLNGGALELKQQWFLADGSVQPDDEKVQWIVPVLLGSDGPNVPKTISFLKAPSHQLSVPLEGAAWLKLNFGQQVPCRVLYPAGMMQRLSQNLGQLPPEDRIGLLSDTFALCKAGHADPTQVVALLRGFGAEDNDKVWAQLSSVLIALHRLISVGFPEAAAKGFAQFAAAFVRPHAERVGWNHDPQDGENVKQLRQILISLLATFCATEPEVWADAKPRYQALVGGSAGDVSADIRGSVLAIAILNDSTSATFEELVKLHDSTKDGALQRDIHAALARAAPALQARALEWVLTEAVKAQDMIWLPGSVPFSGRDGPNMVFEWVKAQFARIYAKLGKTSMMLFSDIVRSSGAGFVSKAKAEEVFAFWKQQPVYDVVQKTLNQTCEAVRTNAQFMDRLLASPLTDAAYWAA